MSEMIQKNELHVGDWVKAYGLTEQISTTHLDSDLVYTWHKTGNKIENDKGEIVDEYENRIVFLKNIEPIPLTAEILEKNGFLMQDKQWWRWWKLDYEESRIEITSTPRLDVWLDSDKRRQSDYSIIMSKSVHEFQHALKLCGLNDLADKFKA